MAYFSSNHCMADCKTDLWLAETGEMFGHTVFFLDLDLNYALYGLIIHMMFSEWKNVYFVQSFLWIYWWRLLDTLGKSW